MGIVVGNTIESGFVYVCVVCLNKAKKILFQRLVVGCGESTHSFSPFLRFTKIITKSGRVTYTGVDREKRDHFTNSRSLKSQKRAKNLISSLPITTEVTE